LFELIFVREVNKILRRNSVKKALLVAVMLVIISGVVCANLEDLGGTGNISETSSRRGAA